MTASSSTHAFSALCGSFCVLADEEQCQLDSCSSMASLSLPWSSVCVSGCECSPLCFCWKLLTLCIEKPVSVIAFYHICLDGCAKQKVFFEWMSMLVAVIGIRRSGLKWTAFSILLMQHLCVRGRIFITVNRRRDICLEVKPQWCQRSINTCLIMTCFLFLLTKCICQLIRFLHLFPFSSRLVWIRDKLLFPLRSVSWCSSWVVWCKAFPSLKTLW